MSTRSNIIYHNIADDNYQVIYCHFDGYPEGVGKKLKENYIGRQKVKELINNGHISSLGRTIEETEFYKDRGETNTKAKTLYDKWELEQFLVENPQGVDYFYLYSCGKWSMVSCKIIEEEL